MNTIRSAIENTVSISQFNRGSAGKIFDDVRKNGAKVVIKNNIPECVLLSPEAYIELLDKIEDMKLLELANQRLATNQTNKLISQKEVDEQFGFKPEDYMNTEDIEFE